MNFVPNAENIKMPKRSYLFSVIFLHFLTNRTNCKFQNHNDAHPPDFLSNQMESNQTHSMIYLDFLGNQTELVTTQLSQGLVIGLIITWAPSP